MALIFIGAFLGFSVSALFFGPWFRQLRATTAPEIIALRFGPATQRFYALLEVPIRIVYAAIHLYGLSIFCSAAFGYNIVTVILVVGAIVIYYSASGGRWAVMATDFLQGLILVPITIIIAVLCLIKLGGIDGLFETIAQEGLSDDFKIINAPEQFAGSFTWGWATAMFFKQFFVNNSMNAAPRFFSVKDGGEARKAAFLAAVLFLLGSLVWFLPPITARLFFSSEVMAMNIAKPAEASYAVVSMQLLPVGLVGMVVVAILTATMSSMDTGLNTNVAIMIKDIYPTFCSWFGIEPKDDDELLSNGRWYTLVMGLLIVLLALNFSRSEGKGIFDIMLNMSTLLATPMAVPLVLGMLLRKSPSWAAFVSIGAAAIPSSMGFFSEQLFGQEWLFQTKLFSVLITGTVAFLLTLPFGESRDPEHQASVQEFFRRMHTPIDFANEIGPGNDLAQLKIIGRLGLVVSLFIALLLFIPNPQEGRIAIFSLFAFLASVSSFMIYKGRR